MTSSTSDRVILRHTHRILFLTLLSFTSLVVVGQVRLPRLISDGMVLQRDAKVRIWGWASINERISIHFADSTYGTKADSYGHWNVVLSRLGAGGPYTMSINGSNALTVNNIMIGDVWVCSGQSNMELTMKRVSPMYETEIANSANDHIRQFSVPQKYNFNDLQEDLQSGSWKAANPENVLDFSAVAYFFGKELQERHGVPIGLINASLGGSPAEAWISEESLRPFPTYFEEAQRFKNETLIKQIETKDNERIGAWHSLLRQKDEGYKDSRKPWYDPDLNTSNWATMKIPGYWSSTELGPVNGVVWFRKTVVIPSTILGTPAKIILGRIVDSDSVFLNGVFVGTTSYQYPPRRYDIPSNLLKQGENSLTVRVINSAGRGGFVPDKQYAIVAGAVTIDLAGDWRYRLGAKMDSLASQTFIRWKPLGLFNGMIAPLLKFRVKGVLWYQGESNANRPSDYKDLFSALIQDWRKNWKQEDLPFLFAQLPNYMEARSQPSESNWALLREAQLRTLSLPNTGMAVTIDLGEWNDIHPLNKRDVSRRLALAAQKVAYGDEKVICAGPTYRSMKVEGSKIVLTFTDVGSGLIGKGGELRHFAVAGTDKRFVWANARIENNNVIVWSDKVSEPIAVRYAWADNPDGANLYNKEGLQASPFRTDDWK